MYVSTYLEEGARPALYRRDEEVIEVSAHAGMTPG